MEYENTNEHLSEISTLWTAVTQAHSGEENAARRARGILLERYRNAIHRYILACACDADEADELSQEFALRFIRGDFHRANPERGRFRNYLKTALINLINDYRRARQRQPQGLPLNAAEPEAPPDDIPDDDREFLANWRQEVLERTWAALAKSNSVYYAALRFRVENTDLGSAEMAEQLAPRLGKIVTAEWVRQTLHRAHRKFAKLLIEEVSSLLESPTLELLHDELLELDLVRYCRSILRQRQSVE